MADHIEPSKITEDCRCIREDGSHTVFDDIERQLWSNVYSTMLGRLLSDEDVKDGVKLAEMATLHAERAVLSMRCAERMLCKCDICRSEQRREVRHG